MELANDMTYAALTPLLGREFDSFLFAPIGDEQDDPMLSVVSALARLDVDPWKEADSLAHMPKQLAIGRLTSLIASLPNSSTTGLVPEVTAARLIEGLPHAAGFSAATAAATATAIRQAAPGRRSRISIGLGVLGVLLVAYFVFWARTPNMHRGGADTPAATSEPAARR